MAPKKNIKTLSRAFFIALLAVGLLVFCTSNVLALFSNAGFETLPKFTGWTKTKFLNTGLTLPQPFTGADINRGPGGDDLSAVLGPFAEMSQTDPHTGGVLHFPRSGSYCARVNSDQAWNDGGHPTNANTIKQTDTAAAGDVAPDGMIHILIAWAAVVQNPNHQPYEQPYIYVSCNNTTKNILLYETFIFAGQSGTIWQNAPNDVQFTDWQVIDRAFTSDNITSGDNIEIEAIAAGCSRGGHWGYLYLDPFGSFYPVTPSITAANKPYDGNTTATITGSWLTGVVPGDDVSLTIGAANFDTKDVGNDKTVTATGLNLTGADADKYMLTSFTVTTTADITADMPTPPPTVTNVSPASGTQGQCLTVTITGSGFTGATPVYFGTGITVNSFTVDSDTQITANICIAADAALGARGVSVTTPDGTGIGRALFTVNVPSGVPVPEGPRASPSWSRPLNPAQLSVQYLSVNPQQTSANQPVTITINAVNTGDEAGNINVALKINGQVEQSRMVSVGPQGTQPVKFTITKAQPGTYNVTILDKSGSFTILGASGTTRAPVNGGVIAIMIMGVLVLATVVVVMLGRHPA